MCPEPVSLLEGSCLKAAALPLKPDVSQTLNSLYAFYRRQWRCCSHVYWVFKLCQALLNGLTLLVVAAGMIAVSISRIPSWLVSGSLGSRAQRME